MSKRKEIHVDKLIVKANEVVIIDNSNRHRRNPWGLGRFTRFDNVEEAIQETNDDIEETTEEVKEVENKPRFRWF